MLRKYFLEYRILLNHRHRFPWPYRTFSSGGSASPKWLQAILKITKFAEVSSDENITKWKNTMQNLEAIGCRSYQILETPHVLKLSEDDILHRIDLMQDMCVKDISIPVIALVNITKGAALSPALRNYKKATNGYVSVGDFWRNFFHCSEADMNGLLLSNPRLLKGTRGLKERWRRAEFLVQAGIPRTELLESSHIILNIPHATIVERVEELQENNIMPLPIKLLSQNERPYRSSLEKRLGHKKSNDSRYDVLKDLLRADKSTLFHPVFGNVPVKSLKNRINYLLGRGYDPESIINCPTILHNIDVGRLEQAFRELDEAGLDDIQLATVVSYINCGRLPAFRKKSQRSMAKKIGLEEFDLADMSHVDFKAIGEQSNLVMKRNYQYLLDQGFPSDIILDVPVVLGHNHELLVEHWEALLQVQKHFFTKWRLDKRKLLNFLQYDIEKSVNFKHAVLTSNTR